MALASVRMRTKEGLRGRSDGMGSIYEVLGPFVIPVVLFAIGGIAYVALWYLNHVDL
jgi:hypothetical protein